MKKWIVIILFTLVTIIVLAYFFIPGTYTIKKSTNIGANPNAAWRVLQSKSKWNQWLPDEPSVISYENLAVSPLSIDAVKTEFMVGGKNIPSTMKIYPITNDSIQILWQLDLVLPGNLFERFPYYLKARRIANDMETTMQQMKSFMQVPQNLYELDVQLLKVTDTLLVATRKQINHYPTTEDIYGLYEKLNKYVGEMGAKQVNPPMLHIQQTGNSSFDYMLAIPVDKQLPDKNDILFKRMVPGNILVTEVRGGVGEINKALNNFDNLVNDYKKISPALPYQSLVTDRREIRDSSRWITKIYYPIF